MPPLETDGGLPKTAALAKHSAGTTATDRGQKSVGEIPVTRTAVTAPSRRTGQQQLNDTAL